MNIRKLKTKLKFKLASRKLRFAEKRLKRISDELNKAENLEKIAYKKLNEARIKAGL